jgi:hypothetical protein
VDAGIRRMCQVNQSGRSRRLIRRSDWGEA